MYNGSSGGLTLRGVEISSSSADAGGGVSSVGPLVLDRSRVTDNSAAVGGGGLALSSRGATITTSTVSGNTAKRLGGGIWAQNVHALELAETLVASNTVTATGAPGVAPEGGGIMVGTEPALGIAATVHISDSTIRSNAAAGGGGLGWRAPGSLTVEGSLFATNTAELGGAVATRSNGTADASNTVTFLNTTFSENAAERGGAIERGLGTTILRAVTIAGNTATAGSGIDFDGARPVYAVATGTILADDPPAQNCSRSGALFTPAEGLSAPEATSRPAPAATFARPISPRRCLESASSPTTAARPAPSPSFRAARRSTGTTRATAP